jgi:hypothetical protein
MTRVHGDKALKETVIYEILKQVKMGKNRRGFTKQKTKMTADLIASVAAAVAEDCRVSILDLARAHGTSYGTISRILHSQLGLVKKSARWVLKLLSTPRRWSRSSWRKKGSKCSPPPPYSPDLAPADYFLFSKLKKELAGITMTQEGVGGGPEGSQQGGVCQGLLALV